MAINYRGEGKAIDFPYVVQTGVTITAGCLVWADVSGTNVVHPVRSYSGATAESNATLPASGTGRGIASLDVTLSGVSGKFMGVMANTQTGATTGVQIFTEGVFEFLTTPTASCNLRIGYPVYASTWDRVINVGALSFADATGTNATGATPIGEAVFFPAGLHVSNTTVRVHVKLYGSLAQRPGL